MEPLCYEPANYYRLLVKFDPVQVREIVEESEEFVKEMAGLLN
jgi:hypothetical protein